MKVIESQRVDFVTGQNLPPEDLNAVFLYAKDALDDIVGRRFSRGVLLLPFVVDVGDDYDQALNAEVLTYRFTCPNTCYIERAYLSANMTSTAEVQWNITKVSGGTTPSGATTPWLSTKGAIVGPADAGASSADGIIASATDDISDTSLDRVLLEAGAEYKIAVTSTGNFSLQRCDIVLHTLTDRWTTGASTTATATSLTLQKDSSAIDATVVNANVSAVQTTAALLASKLDAPVPMLFVKHGLLSTTDADLRTFTVPLADTARARVKVTKIYVYAFVAGACTIKGILKNAAGAIVAEADVVCSGAGFFSDSALAAGALPAALSSSTAGAPANTALDYTFTFENTSGANDGTKVYALVWVTPNA